MAGMSFRRVFVHGAGRRGADAWPSVVDESATFVSFPADAPVSSHVEILAREHLGLDAVVHAHSIGAVPAVLAAATRGPAGLVLVEPALYDLVRGEAVVERHIGIVTEARTRAAVGDLRGFWAILRPLMFGGPFDEVRWEAERPLAEHWATTNVPWGHGVRPGMLHGVPTMVVTGGWNDEYELIAARLVEDGAQHAVLTGAQHRPQDLPGFAQLAREFERSLSR